MCYPVVVEGAVVVTLAIAVAVAAAVMEALQDITVIVYF